MLPTGTFTAYKIPGDWRRELAEDGERCLGFGWMWRLGIGDCATHRTNVRCQEFRNLKLKGNLNL